jgi:chromosomal replication initiator protein
MSTGQHPADADDAGQALWQVCLDELAQEIPEQQFNTWIKPLTAQVADDLSKVTLFVANRFKLDWIRAQYSAKLADILSRLHGQKIQIELALATREAPSKTAFSMAKSALEARPESTDSVEDAQSDARRHRLNAALTFETLVEGSANRMARAAAMHVATMPGHLYNPLFIYGGVGLGKTH